MIGVGRSCSFGGLVQLVTGEHACVGAEWRWQSETDHYWFERMDVG